MSTEADQTMEHALNLIFAGKKVAITDTLKGGDKSESKVFGVCKIVHVDMLNIDIELDDGSHLALTLNNSTPNSLEGDVDWMLRRRVELA